MLRVGLTGAIAAGKSTVGQILHESGATVFDADRIVADLYRPGAEGSRAVERLFGRELLDESGAVSKTALARLAFDDRAARRKLEAAIHPLVAAEIRRRFADAERGGAGIAVAEASQILEGGYRKEFDRILLVVAPDETRVTRGEGRGVSAAETRRRSAAQLSPVQARASADDVIENAGTLAELREEVAALCARWRKLPEHAPARR